MFWEKVKELVAKCITTGIVGGAAYLMNAPNWTYALLGMAMGYSIWTKVIVPLVDSYLQPVKGTSIATKNATEKFKF